MKKDEYEERRKADNKMSLIVGAVILAIIIALAARGYKENQNANPYQDCPYQSQC